MINILDRKYFSEWANGTAFSSNTSDFATHLKGSAGEKLKYVVKIQAALMAVSTESNMFEVVNGNMLQRNDGGSWIKDGFAKGQTLYLLVDFRGGSGNTPSIDPGFSGGKVVSALSDSQILFTTSIGAPDLKRDHALVCTDKFDALNYNFGIIENSAPDNLKSPYTDDLQGYNYPTINVSASTVHTMNAIGGNSASKSWKSGDATVKWVQSTDPFSLGVSYLHEYEITQEFVINPVFLESYLTALNNGTQPPDFIGDKTLKHIAEYKFLYSLTNPNTSVLVTDSTILGSVGWFNENYNGFNDIYDVDDVEYEDTATGIAVDGLQLKRKTTISFTLTGSGFTNTSKAGIYFFWAAPISVYQAKQSSFQNTFLWDNIIGTMTAGAFSTTGAERIKRFELTYVDANNILVEADIEFSADEIDLINPDSLAVVPDKYFIGVQAGNTSATDDSNKVIVQTDWAEFVVNNDVEDLATFTNQRFYDHGMDEDNGGNTSYRGWKQDGFQYACSINLNKALNANIKALSARLIAYNTDNSESFELQKYTFNLADLVLVNASTRYQQLEIDTTRGFRLADGDQFNKVSMFFNVPVSNIQEVELKLGMKFDWQSWLKLPDADTIFYDASLDSKGMGKDASRYSMNNDYQIRLVVDVDVKQLDEIATRYTDLSPYLDIYGWGLDEVDPARWGVVIETFDLDDNDLGGAILSNADTLMRATWTPLGGSTDGFDNQWAIHRIEAAGATNYNNIDELSSFRDSRIQNLLKPLTGEDFLKITDDGSTVVTECLIDFTRLQGTAYNLSARLGRVITQPRYRVARDIKRLTDTEVLLFNCADNGIAVSNSLRIATVNAFDNIVSEVAIALSGAHTYQNAKIAVADNIVNNDKPNFYMVCFTGTATVLHEFIFNGTTYIQSTIFNTNIGGSGPCFIRVDPALEPNDKPYIWFGNKDANIGGEKGCKHASHDGAAWQYTDWKCFTTAGPSNSECAHITDLIHDNFNVYVMNYDNPAQADQWNQGKIAMYLQTSGDIADPADRTNFANYTLVQNIYRNSGDTENQDGPGNDADLAFANGFEILEIDENSLPVFLTIHDVTLGTNGARHFGKIFANTDSPTTEADFTIETPFPFTNDSFGNPEALSGSITASSQTSPLQRKNNCHILVLGPASWITGHQSKPYWVIHVDNDWWIWTPNDPDYDFSSGNTLKE